MFIKTCSYCKKEKPGSQFWNCSGYHGITGRFCSDCYDMIAHDSYGNPKNPEKFTWFLLTYGNLTIKE